MRSRWVAYLSSRLEKADGSRTCFEAPATLLHDLDRLEEDFPTSLRFVAVRLRLC